MPEFILNKDFVQHFCTSWQICYSSGLFEAFYVPTGNKCLYHKVLISSLKYIGVTYLKHLSLLSINSSISNSMRTAKKVLITPGPNWKRLVLKKCAWLREGLHQEHTALLRQFWRWKVCTCSFLRQMVVHFE